MRWLMLLIFLSVVGCIGETDLFDDEKSSASDLTLDPTTGIPYAFTFTFPVEGFDTSDFGFGYGAENRRFCLERTSDGQCVAYGYHLGRDTLVSQTAVGTDVVAPGDGIVRLTTDQTYGGYGSDTSSNPSYRGCLIVLEHEFANGQPVLTLLGHVKCESGVTYDPIAKTGNPVVGTLVKRGQYLAHVAHYWAGSGTSSDWHHVHWAMRDGPFSSLSVSAVVKGYAKKSEFTADPSTGTLVHPDWLDPFLVVAANGDPALQAAANVRHHPSGTLLEASDGHYHFVASNDSLAPVGSETFAEANFDPARAIRVSDEELGCYHETTPYVGEGPAVLYKRPNSSTVVMAYPEKGIRYDVIRWEALLSWGYDGSELLTDPYQVGYYETHLLHAGFRLLRPGTLVKADEVSEVAIVSAAQTRQPIASGDVFEALGYRWEDIISIPQSVLTEVAGPRESTLVDSPSIHACVVPAGCTTCGGGGPSEDDPPGDLTTLDFNYVGPVSPGSIQLYAWWQPPNAAPHSWSVVSECVDSVAGDGLLACSMAVPSGTAPFVFQIMLPDGRFWGDFSCSPQGGCGQTVGSVSVSGPQGPLSFDFIPNNSEGQPYMNGSISVVP